MTSAGEGSTPGFTIHLTGDHSITHLINYQTQLSPELFQALTNSHGLELGGLSPFLKEEEKQIQEDPLPLGTGRACQGTWVVLVPALTAAAGHHTWGEADFSQMVPNRACANLAFLAAVLSFWFINRAHSVCSFSGSTCSESAQPLWNQHVESRDIPSIKEQRARPQHLWTGVEISAYIQLQVTGSLVKYFTSRSALSPVKPPKYLPISN